MALLAAGVHAQIDWQQRVDTELFVTLDDVNHELRGHARIAYQNNSPETLDFVWMHLWPNAYRNGKTALAKQQFRDGDMFMFYAMSRDLGGIDSLAFTSNGKALEELPPRAHRHRQSHASCALGTGTWWS